MKTYPHIEVCSADALPKPASGTNLIVHYVFQYIDFTQVPEYWTSKRFIDCIFFGCTIPNGMGDLLEACLVLPRMRMRFQVFGYKLYTGETLYKDFDPDHPETFDTCFDSAVYKDYVEQGNAFDDVRTSLARSLHDYSIRDAMNDLLSRYNPLDVVGIMGGHRLKRTDPFFRQIVLISKTLTEKGKLMVSGGGPGAMEATHIGAWMAGREEADVDDALSMLACAPTFEDEGWLASAFKVRQKYPQRRYHSLGVPTWLYGHEPSTPFATEIAKYFQNSIREDTILTIGRGGIIFTPGSAGTLQEIFQDATLNHYLVNGDSSPMIFLGKDYYTQVIPVYPFMMKMIEEGKYRNLKLYITDDTAEVVDILMKDF